MPKVRTVRPDSKVATSAAPLLSSLFRRCSETTYGHLPVRLTFLPSPGSRQSHRKRTSG
ncbi:hypothetical protein DPMN_156559 [Dreissena polymorpha]|uniref:Uncharacterized protein n=1 Tax=Dreissena polymorpha TaxID=45954 RepID=A0A9D4JBY7_DREPO|nr:hypothetical protein DPMN_156559 [Dreissena polymorpha]